MPRDPLDAPVLRGPELRRLLDEHRIVWDSMKRPSREALDTLALALSVLRWRVSSLTADEATRFQNGASAWRRYQAALDELAAATRDLRDWHSPAPQTGEAKAAILGKFESLILGMRLVSEKLLYPAAPPDHWHDIVAELAERFREAMRSTNRGLRLGNKARSPLVRFLRDVAIPFVTDEAPKADAISMYLKRHPPRGGQKSEGICPPAVVPGLLGPLTDE
jgi:hypothetical protein